MATNSCKFFFTCYQSLDYETTSSYSLTVNVSDGTTTVSQPLTISIRDVNDAPLFTDAPYSVSVNENEAAGAVYTVSASDPDSGKFSNENGFKKSAVTPVFAISGDSSCVVQIYSGPARCSTMSYHKIK